MVMMTSSSKIEQNANSTNCEYCHDDPNDHPRTDRRFAVIGAAATESLKATAAGDDASEAK